MYVFLYHLINLFKLIQHVHKRVGQSALIVFLTFKTNFLSPYENLDLSHYIICSFINVNSTCFIIYIPNVLK